MPKRLIRFNLQQKQAIKGSFLKDPQADFIVILQKRIFPLHKKLLQSSQYFNQIIAANKKTVSIQENFNPDFFQKILGCFYGIQATFQRHYIVDHILKILQLLKVKQLKQQLKNDMQVNFEQYGLFNLFYLQEIFNMQDIQDRCLKQLIDQEFQQINYNKYDLFQLSPKLFIYILKSHQRLKAKRTIAGLDSSLLRAVCQQYCKTNCVQINVNQIFRYGKQCLEQSLSDFEQKQTIMPRKKNSTWHNIKIRRLSMELDRKISRTADISSSPPKNKKQNFEEKQNEVQKTKELNGIMEQKNNQRMAEINLVKSTMSENSQQNSYGMDELKKKMKQFEQKSNIAHKKLQQIKNKMLKINQQYSDDQDNQRELQKLIYLKNNLQNYSKVLSGIGMAVLDKQSNIGSGSSDF